MQIRPRSTAENTSALELEAQQPHAPHDPSHPASSSSSRSRPASPSDLTDQTHHLPPLKAVLAFVALGLTTLLAVLDSSIVANAVSRMTDDLGQGDKSAWIGASYLITMSGFCCVSGRLGDIFGRKWLVICAIVEFMIASLGCALSQTMTQMIVFRAFQGVGAAAQMCLAQGMSADLVPLEKRPRYQLTIEVIILVGGAAGPLLGGVFAQYNWRWCYWINLPLGLVALLGVVFLIPAKPVEGGFLRKLRQVDFVGAAISLAASTLVLVALNQGGSKHPWDSYQILLPLIIGFLGFGAFGLWESFRAQIPLVPMRLFKQRSVSSIWASTLISGMIWYLLIFYLPLYYELVKNRSIIMAGVLLLPLVVVVSPFVILSVLLMKRLNGGFKECIIAGYAVLAIALGLMSTVKRSTPLSHIIGFLVLAAAANAFTLQTSIIGVQTTIEQKDVAVTLSSRLFFKQIGGAIGVVVGSTIINNELAKSTLSEDVISLVTDAPLELLHSSAVSAYEKNLAVEGFTSGFQVIFLVAAVVSAIACLISLPIKSSPLKKEKPQEKENEEDDGSVDASSEKDEEEK